MLDTRGWCDEKRDTGRPYLTPKVHRAGFSLYGTFRSLRWRGVEKNKLIFKRCRPVTARYLGCGICMKACPIQKYGMKTVMEHYAATGQVLDKGTHDLEGYVLEEKGYFGPGELPLFDGHFFRIPHGRAEDWAFEELRTKMKETGSPEGAEGQQAFE